jgi:hypothetical protein
MKEFTFSLSTTSFSSNPMGLLYGQVDPSEDFLSAMVLTFCNLPFW